MGTTESDPTGALSESRAYAAPPETLFSGASQLCPSLNQVFSAHDALPHLIDFMEDRNILHFLHFWLDCEQFYGVCRAQIQSADSIPTKTEKFASVDLHETSLRAAPSSKPQPFTHEIHRESPMPPTRSTLLEHSSACGDGKQNCVPLRPNGFVGVGMKPSPSMRRFNKDIQDNAVRIYSQYISLEAPDSVGIDQEMRSQILDNMCQEDECVGIDCFRPAQDKVFEMLNDKVFVEFLPSYHFLRYKSGLILSDRLSLADILNCTATLERFVEFVEEVDGTNFVRFILNAIQYEAQWSSATRLGQYNAEWAQNDAMTIYNTHVSMQAFRPIDLADSLRSSIEEKICSEKGVPVDCFHRAVCAVYGHLSAVYLPAFFKSQPFLSYLVDLDGDLKRAMVAAGIFVPQAVGSTRRHILQTRSTGSSISHGDIPECHRAASSSSVPASETGRNRAGSECDSRSSHSMDCSGTSARLRKMAMGEVDALGRFVSYSEGEPPAEVKNGILSRAVRRLNRTREKQLKKEQASLDAQRIIEDTLSQAMSVVSPFSG